MILGCANTRSQQDEFRLGRKCRLQEYSYVVPNRLTCPDIDPTYWMPEDMTDIAACMDSSGIGTHSVSIAAGTKFGVARKAELYFVKMANQYKEIYLDGTSVPKTKYIQAGAFRTALEHVMDVVRERDLEGKAVVHIGLGTYRTYSTFHA
jgi:hypothetical protein